MRWLKKMDIGITSLPWMFFLVEKRIVIAKATLHNILRADFIAILQRWMPTLSRWAPLQSPNFCRFLSMDCFFNIVQTADAAIRANLRCTELIHLMTLKKVRASFLDIFQRYASLSTTTTWETSWTVEHNMSAMKILIRSIFILDF